MWNFEKINQEVKSSSTSINKNKMPASIKKIEGLIEVGSKWADIGGGKFDNVIDFFKKKKSQLFVFDPFNREFEHNQVAVQNIKDGQCDGVLINNVLNVILEKGNREIVIKQAHNCLKDGAKAFFLIYEGDQSGMVKYTQNGKSIQLNKKTIDYIEEIKEVFGDSVVKSGELLIAKKELINDLEPLKKSLVKVGIKRFKSVGKKMGTALYVHKDYVEEIFNVDSYKKALEKIGDFPFNIVKYEEKVGSYTFINSPDFDISDEPVIAGGVIVDKDGKTKVFTGKKDPQIYHHKWLFVKDNYRGFDVIESIKRSIKWKSVMGVNREVSSRIGTKSFWDNWCKVNLATYTMGESKAVKSKRTP